MAKRMIDCLDVRDQELLNFVNVFLREVRLLTSRDPMVMEAAQTAKITCARALDADMFSFFVKAGFRGVSGRHFLKVRDGVSIVPFGNPELEAWLGSELLDVSPRDVVRAIRESTIHDVLGW